MVHKSKYIVRKVIKTKKIASDNFFKVSVDFSGSDFCHSWVTSMLQLSTTYMKLVWRVFWSCCGSRSLCKRVDSYPGRFR